MPPAVTTQTTLTQYAQELLDLAVAALADSSAGPMERYFLVHGTPVHDCAQVTVAVTSIGDASFPAQSTVGAGQRHITGALNLYGFQIEITRCLPVIDSDGNPPEPAAETTAASGLHEDVVLVWNRVRQAKRNGDLFGGLCELLFFDGARAVESQGGFGGWQIDFRADIAGFPLGT